MQNSTVSSSNRWDGMQQYRRQIVGMNGGGGEGRRIYSTYKTASNAFLKSRSKKRRSTTRTCTQNLFPHSTVVAMIRRVFFFSLPKQSAPSKSCCPARPSTIAGVRRIFLRKKHERRLLHPTKKSTINTSEANEGLNQFQRLIRIQRRRGPT